MSEDNPDLDIEDGAADSEAGGDDQAPKGKPDQTQALLRKLRKAEKDLETFRKADEERNQQSLSEVDKLKAELQKREAEYSSLTEKLRMQSIEFAFEQAASKAGVIDADAAKRLANLSEIEIDDDGKVLGIDAVIADLKKTRKYLFGPLNPVGSSGGNPSAGPPGKVTADQVKRMSSEDLEKFAQTLRSQRL